MILLAILQGCASAPSVPGGALDVALDGVWQTNAGPQRLPLALPRTQLVATRTVVMPEDWDRDRRAILRGNAIGYRVRAWLGDAEVGSDAGGLRPIAIDLTGQLKPGNNALRIVVETASATNILDGEKVTAVGAYTYQQPRTGEVEALGELWLELADARRVDDVDIAYAGGELTARATVSGAEGEPVLFTVVRDGAELARFPTSTVSHGVAEATVAWTGPRWELGGSEAPFLQYVVAALPGGATRQVRFGAREVTRNGTGLALNGTPTYLAVQRHVADGSEPRDELAQVAALYASANLNTLELHARLHPDAVLQAADELGFPVVLTPLCDGRRRSNGVLPADAAWAAFIEEGNRRIVAAHRDHPSLVLWNLEAPAEPAFPSVYAPLGSTDVPFVDHTESQGYNDEGWARMRYERTYPFINELAFRAPVLGGETLLQRLGWLVRSHRAQGIGCTVPHLLDRGDPEGKRAPEAVGYRAGLVALFSDLDVPALPVGPRRGPAELDVTVRRADAVAAGVIVVLRAPGQAPVAAATDQQGIAHLALDYAGPAEVEVLGVPGPTAVTLTSGRYEGGRWRPAVATATLTLP
ncbi:MAG: hypothetical protein Q8P41_31230 [Pseudomonadota bacterium]|nr:hypothetical protein [Pseudomonadota bacterium]